MKQCLNPNCTIYTSLEELPDAYLRCPLCKEPLVEATFPTGMLSPTHLNGDEATSPYIPIKRPRYVQPPQYGRDPYVNYDNPEPEYDEAETDAEAEALDTTSARALQRARGCAIAAGAFALLATCALLVVIVGSRFLPQPSVSSGPVATQITEGSGIRDQGSGIRDQVPVTKEPTPDPRPPIPIQDALMCARLDAGQPIGPTRAYHPTDPFNLAVLAEFGPGGAVNVLTRWYGPDGSPIYDLKQNYSQHGTYYAGFTLAKATPWAAGDYRVEIYTNNSTQPVQTVSFGVISP